MNPYKVLGVPRNAGAECIKAAYRKRAMETHPDTGGDPLAFQEVREAYTVLSDPGRRRHFDETGEVKLPQPDNAHAAVAGVLSNIFGAVFGQLLNDGKNPTREDVVALMRRACESALEKMRQQRASGEKAMKALRDILGRFTEGEGEPVLETLVASQVDGLAACLRKLGQEEDVHRKALEYLKGCAFRHEPAAVLRGYATTAATGGWTLRTS